MDRAHAPGRTATALLASVLLVFIIAATAAIMDDYLMRDHLPVGATVAGVSVGGMTKAAASRLIERQVAAPLLAPVSVTFRGKSETLDPSALTTTDIDEVLTQAFAPKAEASLLQRVWWRVSGASYGHETTGIMQVDAEGVSEWVAQQRSKASVPAVDASVSVEGSKLKITPAQPGISFDATAAADALTDALLSGTKTLALIETTTSPATTDEMLGKTIFVSTSRRTLTLYNGARIEKKYQCAVGTPGYPTPLGTFKIVLKRYLPTWRNPGSGWAKDMPAYIGPGPGNPLGTRALNLDAPGIRIHGTSKDYSIGTAASHGCMRMHMWDIEDLYPRVPLGTRVIIVS